MRLSIVLQRRDDGRWLAEIPELPAIAVLGDDRMDAFRRAQASALRHLADDLEHERPIPGAPAELSVKFNVV